jgi:hypothetical protein
MVPTRQVKSIACAVAAAVVAGDTHSHIDPLGNTLPVTIDTTQPLTYLTTNVHISISTYHLKVISISHRSNVTATSGPRPPKYISMFRHDKLPRYVGPPGCCGSGVSYPNPNQQATWHPGAGAGATATHFAQSRRVRWTTMSRRRRFEIPSQLSGDGRRGEVRA